MERHWLSSQKFRPRDIWDIAALHIDIQEPCLLITDDTVLSKQYGCLIFKIKKFKGNS